ncbi:GNAT family N-acetyltransferase [Chitinilyticum litopenaei]|uniref:GNAT family N-acetyltransferase n=1 Tax=Chitinilyticum litopenaei TaxID=1121276 RepID=UPI0003FF965D|nr:GNAT family N-acetyltransferase [Chitinilyticum litopenaei]
MTEPIRIRPPAPAELLWLSALTRQNMQPFYRQHAKEWDEAVFQTSLAQSCNLLMLHREECIGALRYTIQPPFLYLNDLQVSPGWQRRGYGRMLLRHAFCLAAAAGLSTLRLAVFKSNPAIALYHEQGFAIVGEHGKLWRMACSLPEADE